MEKIPKWQILIKIKLKTTTTNKKNDKTQKKKIKKHKENTETLQLNLTVAGDTLVAWERVLGVFSDSEVFGVVFCVPWM